MAVTFEGLVKFKFRFPKVFIDIFCDCVRSFFLLCCFQFQKVQCFVGLSQSSTVVGIRRNFLLLNLLFPWNVEYDEELCVVV